MLVAQLRSTKWWDGLCLLLLFLHRSTTACPRGVLSNVCCNSVCTRWCAARAFLAHSVKMLNELQSSGEQVTKRSGLTILVYYRHIACHAFSLFITLENRTLRAMAVAWYAIGSAHPALAWTLPLACFFSASRFATCVRLHSIDEAVEAQKYHKRITTSSMASTAATPVA